MLETTSGLEYLNMVISEVLRFQCPAPQTSMFEFTKDVKVGGINFRQGDVFNFFIHALHYNGNEWQRPDDFEPMRFDPQDPISLTPSG